MPKRNIHARLERLSEGITPPDNPGDREARAKMVETLETMAELILEHGDEVDRDYRERVAAGQDHRGALIAAKRAVWGRTAEGREALAVFDAVQDRGGG